jgi:hypothetical protein
MNLQTSQRIIALGKKHIEEQRARIARQRELVARLELERNAPLVRSARELLEDMMDVLHRMIAEHRTARQKLSNPSERVTTKAPPARNKTFRR